MQGQEKDVSRWSKRTTAAQRGSRAYENRKPDDSSQPAPLSVAGLALAPAQNDQSSNPGFPSQNLQFPPLLAQDGGRRGHLGRRTVRGGLVAVSCQEFEFRLGLPSLHRQCLCVRSHINPQRQRAACLLVSMTDARPPTGTVIYA